MFAGMSFDRSRLDGGETGGTWTGSMNRSFRAGFGVGPEGGILPLGTVLAGPADGPLSAGTTGAGSPGDLVSGGAAVMRAGVLVAAPVDLLAVSGGVAA